MLSILLASSVFAAPAVAPIHDHAAELAQPFGHDLLWRAYLRFFEPEALAPDDLPPPICATALVEALKQEWDSFDADERARITRHVAPFLPDLRAEMPQVHAVSAPVNGMAPPPTQVCWGSFLSNRIEGAHFSVEWETGTLSQSEAESLLDELELSYAVQVDQLGWRAPEGSEQFLMPFYVVDGFSASAYTTVNYCDGRYLPYVVAYSGSFFGGTWWMDMQTHEFNHASQWGYGSAIEFWWWEATATYMQEYVYPSHNEWAPYITGYADQPWVAMSASDQQDYEIFWHMYGMAIWNFWIDENFGGVDTILAMWDYSLGQGGYYNLDQQEMLTAAGQDFPTVYKGFTAANTVMTYAEQSWFGSVRLVDDESDLPADGAPSTTERPEAFGQNYIRFNLPAPDPDKDAFEFTFTGAEPANWLVQIVGTGTSEIKTIVEIPVEGSTGVGRLENYGDYGQVFVVVSPRKDDPGSYDYSWSARAVEGEPDAPAGDTGVGAGDGTGTGDSPDVVASASGCGCATDGAGALAGWTTVAGALLALRRRR
jgi:MYXO-CTERM domain-containing protein